MEHALLYSYQLSGDGAGRRVPASEIGGLLKSDALGWAHLRVGHPDTAGFLKRNLKGLDPAILQALMADETRPRATEIGDGFLIVLRGINTEKDAEAEDLVSIRLWIDPRRIMSLQRKRVQAVIDIANLIDAGRGPAGPGQFVAALVENLTLRMEPLLSEINDAADDIEERIIERPDRALRGDLVDLRRQTIALRRYMAPQRDALSALLLGRVDWLREGDRRSLHEQHDRMQRMLEDLDEVRERSQIIKDELTNDLAERMNRNMFVLTLVGAIFLPLSFLTGLMGVNIGGMPGADADTAFWLFCAMLAMFVAVELMLFRLLKWI